MILPTHLDASPFVLVGTQELVGYVAAGAAVLALVFALMAWLAAKGAQATSAEKAEDVMRRVQQALADSGDKEGGKALANVQRELQNLKRTIDEMGESLEARISDAAKAITRSVASGSGGTAAKAAPKRAAAPAPKPAAAPAPKPAAASAPRPAPAADANLVFEEAPAAAPKPAPMSVSSSSNANVEFSDDNGLLRVKVHYREVKRPEAQELVSGVFDRTESKGSKVLLDLSETAYVNSSGLSAITKIAVERDCRLILTAEDVIKVMDLMGFLPLLTICATEDEALRSFAEGA